jgi:hypothetical protein
MTEEQKAANIQAAINVLVELSTALGGAGQYEAAGRVAMGAAVIRAVWGWYQAARAAAGEPVPNGDPKAQPPAEEPLPA